VHIPEYTKRPSLYTSVVNQPRAVVISFQANKKLQPFNKQQTANPARKFPSGCILVQVGREHDVAIFQPRFTPVNQGPHGIMELFTLKANRRQQDLKILLFIQKERNSYEYLPLVT
jgi:hypothetical protein